MTRTAPQHQDKGHDEGQGEERGKEHGAAMGRVLALDIGGTKFAAAVVDATGEMLDRVEVPIGADPTATLAALVTSFASSPGLTGVGIGTAGPLDRGRVSPVNIPSWREFPLADTVSQLAGGLPVAVAGDAQCMALGEWWRGGHASPGRTLLGVVVSTGVGGGLVVDGAPFLGPTGNAGHIGHITVDPHGEPCPCGAVGCVETIASGPAMTRWALSQGWQPTTATPPIHTPVPSPPATAHSPSPPPSAPFSTPPASAPLFTPPAAAASEPGRSTADATQPPGASPPASASADPGRTTATARTGPPRAGASAEPGPSIPAMVAPSPLGSAIAAIHAGRIDARMLAADARTGVPIAVAAFERAADALAIAFLTAAALCDIDRVVVGGGVSAAGDTLMHPLRQAVKRRAGMAFLRRLQIGTTSLGRDAGLYGAAALALFRR